MKDIAKELVKLEELKHVPRVSMHPGHDPSDPHCLLTETIAMVMCSGCSGGEMRWRDRQSDEFVHAEPFGYDAVDCDANHMLNAALKIGVPIYTGAELEFPDPED